MKTVLITGATGDIGQAIVKAFKGWNVVIQYNKNEQKADQLLKEVSGIKVQCDVSDFDSVENMFKIARRTFGKIDVLINNAGIQLIKMLADTTPQEWHSIIDTDLTSVFNTTKCALEDMMYQGGKIINISSIWGISGASCEVAYSAAKAGVIGFTKALAQEYSNINVNCICPGVIESKMNGHLSEEEKQNLIDEIPLRRFGKTDEVAQLCLFLAGKGDYITGETIKLDGGFLK